MVCILNTLDSSSTYAFMLNSEIILYLYIYIYIYIYIYEYTPILYSI